MKLCKVTITKNRNAEDTQTDFNYPEGYDAKVLSPYIYQNEGKGEEYCLATVPDDFKFTDDMVEISKTDAENLVDSWIDDDKDLKKSVQSEKITTTDLTTFKTRKKAWCDVCVGSNKLK